MDRLEFLVPYPHAMYVNYGWAIGLYGVARFGNLFATMFVVARRFSLKPLVRGCFTWTNH
jgi:hypothetical protein